MEKAGSSDTRVRDDAYLTVPQHMMDVLAASFGLPEAFLKSVQAFYRVGGGEMVASNEVKRRRVEDEQARQSNSFAPGMLSVTSHEIGNLLKHNGQQRLRVVTAGTQMLKLGARAKARVDNGGYMIDGDSYRAAQEPIRFLFAASTKRKMLVSAADLAVVCRVSAHKSKDAKARKIRDRFPGTPFAMLSGAIRAQLRSNGGAAEGAAAEGAAEEGAAEPAGLAGPVFLALVPEQQAQYVKWYGQPLALSFFAAGSTLMPLVNKAALSYELDRVHRAGLVDPAEADAIDVDAAIVKHLSVLFDERMALVASKQAESAQSASASSSTPADADAEAGAAGAAAKKSET